MTTARARRVVWVMLLALTSAAMAAAPPVVSVAFAPPLGAVLPLDARFVDEHGRAVRLGNYFGSRPAIVVPVYYGCGNLCGVVLNGLASALRAAALVPGRDVEVIAIGIAPLETPSDAMRKKAAVLGAQDPGGWHFLTGHDDAIEIAARVLGYRYAWDDATHQYAHASGMVIVSPSGRTTSALFGVDFAPADLRAAIAQARDEMRASDTSPATPARTWLLCFHYDPQTGRYSVVAMNAVRAVALVVLAALGVVFVRARWRETRHGRGKATR